MKKITLFLSVLASVLVLAGCTTANEAVKSASAKNVNASGVVSVQDIERVVAFRGWTTAAASRRRCCW